MIDFLVMESYQDAIRGVPWIDNLILFNKDRYKRIADLIRFAKKLNENDYDMVIDLHAKFRSIIIASQIRSKTIRFRRTGTIYLQKKRNKSMLKNLKRKKQNHLQK